MSIGSNASNPGIFIDFFGFPEKSPHVPSLPHVGLKHPFLKFTMFALHLHCRQGAGAIREQRTAKNSMVSGGVIWNVVLERTGLSRLPLRFSNVLLVCATLVKKDVRNLQLAAKNFLCDGLRVLFLQLNR